MVEVYRRFRNRSVFTRLHCATFQKAVICILAAVGTQNLTRYFKVCCSVSILNFCSCVVLWLVPPWPFLKLQVCVGRNAYLGWDQRKSGICVLTPMPVEKIIDYNQGVEAPNIR
jgi:hypothetical protein